MDEEQHCDKFDVDNDYEGLQWIGGEAFFKAKRQKRQQTKDDQLYGVFADNSSDEDDRPRRKKEKEAANYSKPVSFVSKGVIQKEDDQQPKAKEAGSRATVDAAPAQESRPGLGSSSARAAAESDEGDDDDEHAVLPTAFGKRVKEAAEARLKEKHKEHAAQKRKQVLHADDPGFASFNKHSKGIGMKLLEKMGYKAGMGLGRQQQGINKPLEAKLRPKNMGMGFGDRQEAGLTFTGAVEEEPEEKAPAAEAPAGEAKLWKRKNTAVRMRREYRSAEEVMLTAASEGTLPVLQPILDLRGPQARVVTNMEHLNAKVSAPSGKKTPMPELQHNLQLIVDLTEAQLQKLDAKLRHEQDTATLLAAERVRLHDEVAHHADHLTRVVNVMNEAFKCQARDSGMTLVEIERAYTALKAKFREEYVLMDLAAVALAQALPRLQALMRGWQPFEQPRHGLVEFATWKELLECETRGVSGLFNDSQDPYTMLVFEVLMPPMRSAVVSGWEPRNPEALLGLMELWEALLPPPAVSHVLDMLVMPRLRAVVSEWEPRRETVPIHVWVHPWLQYLAVQLEELYPTIRYRLAQALRQWHPSDNSALLVLQPWQRVWQAPDWEKMLADSIVPPLQKALGQLVINPAAQALEPFQWAMAWAEAMPGNLMASVLEVGFFPKWHQVLHHWLSSSPDFDEVTRWYLGWKGLFPQSVLDSDRVRAQFNYALNLMNSAVDGQPLPPYQAPVWQAAAAGAGGVGYGAGVGVGGLRPSAEMSLKELVGKFAEEHGISFLPKPLRVHEGLQIYAFGSLSVVLDAAGGIIRAQVRDRWAPVSLERLLQEQLQRAA